ncbi:hypothetical protein CIB84_010585, partial [Bambusicola thoracicus]
WGVIRDSETHFHVPCQYATSYCVYSQSLSYKSTILQNRDTERINDISLCKEIGCRTDLQFSRLVMFSLWTGSPPALQHSYLPFSLRLLVIPYTTVKKTATDTFVFQYVWSSLNALSWSGKQVLHHMWMKLISLQVCSIP